LRGKRKRKKKRVPTAEQSPHGARLVEWKKEETGVGKGGRTSAALRAQGRRIDLSCPKKKVKDNARNVERKGRLKKRTKKKE